MRPTQTIIAALIVSAILGTGASMVEVQGTPEPVQVDVPVMHHGDRYEYTVQYRASPDAAWESTPYIAIFEIGHPESHLDAAARPTPAVPVTHWYLGLDHQPIIVEWISLETRLVIDTEYVWHSPPAILESSASEFMVDRSRLPGISFQGQMVVQNETTETLEQVPQTLARTEGGGGGGGGWPMLDTWTFGPYRWDPAARPHWQPDDFGMRDAQVGGAATYDGHIVLPVRWNESQPRGTEATLHHTMWVSNHQPVPLLVETTRYPADGQRPQQDWRNILSHSVHGATPVSWGRPAEPPLPTERGTTGALHPADGTGSRLQYPLSQAIKDVTETGADPEWLTWQVQHPAARLVGAEFTRGAMSWTEQPTHEWRLYFADGTEGFEVRTERHPSAPVAVVDAMGTLSLPDVTAAEPVEGSITIAEAERLWRRTFDHPEDEEPTYMHWGVYPAEWNSGGVCLSGLYSGDGAVPAPLDDVASIQVGRSPHGPCQTNNSTGDYEALEVELGGPTLIGTFRTTLDLSPTEPNTRGDTGTREPQALATTDTGFTWGAPDPLVTAAVATSLLALFLTAFFSPAIKFTATQAWLAIPAFSRVKRSDVLNHKERERLLAHIEANPGTTPSELAKATGLGWGTVVHHLDTMAKHGVVRSRVEGRHRRFFSTDTVTADDIDAHALLANAHTQRFYTALIDEPGLGVSELAERLGVSPPGAHQQLQRLASSGLVERQRDGRRVRYYPLPVPPRPYDPAAAVEVA